MIKNSSLQTTLKNSISFSGISLHKGIVSNLIIKPAKEDTGIIFKRIDKINNNIIKAIPQSASGITYAKKIYKVDEVIDWDKDANDVLNQIRALSKRPGAKCRIKDETIKVIDAEVVKCEEKMANGTIVDNPIVVKCAKNAIKINILQRPGKKIMSSKDVINDWSIIKGSKMENIK